MIRALRPPYPGAHLEYNGEEYVVGRADVLSDCFDGAEYAEPGKILEIWRNTIIVKSGDGIVAYRSMRSPIRSAKESISYEDRACNSPACRRRNARMRRHNTENESRR